MTGPITLVQLTDTHLLAQPQAELRGCIPWHTLQAVLTQLASHRPDGVLLTGDLADQGDAAAYRRLRSVMQALEIPVYWLPGNHDHLPTLQRVFRAPGFAGLRSIDLGTWRLLLLNSVLPQARFGEGYLAADQLHWLQTELSRHREQPTLIALHHHPVPTGIDWLDQMPVLNATDFLAIVDTFPQVRLVLFGHIHQALAQPRLAQPGQPAVVFYGCPSTCLQVTPAIATPHAHLPGFRLLSLLADGSHRTQVQRVHSVPIPHD